MTQPQRIALAGTLIVGRLAAGALLVLAGVEAVHFAAFWWDARHG